MPRSDIHLDAMLRHLGAAYYESLHGRATRADVNRALDTVAEHLNEQAAASGHPAGSQHPATAGELMTTPAITIGPQVVDIIDGLGEPVRTPA